MKGIAAVDYWVEMTPYQSIPLKLCHFNEIDVSGTRQC